MTAMPQPERPDIVAGYGIPDTPPAMAWEWVERQLLEARNYWIATTRRDGRPHAMPVWGLWLDGAVMFSTGRGSVKHRNIERNPEIVVHLESGDDAVIVEGRVKVVSDAALLGRFVELYEQKYAFRPDPADPNGLYYALRPRVVLAWREQDFVNTAARWRFDPGP